MGRHSLWHVDVVSVAVVGVHSVGMGRWTLMCSPGKKEIWVKQRRLGNNSNKLSYNTQTGNTYVGCCIIRRLWTSSSMSCGCSLCTDAPSGAIWWGRVWWSEGRCWASGALEVGRWWPGRGGGGAGGTTWLEGWDGSGAWKVWTVWGMT